MRLEYKFLIKRKLLPELRRSFYPYVQLDPYAQLRDNQEYIVRSIYFDTNELCFYHEKIAGIQIRKKIRIRGYNEYDNSNKLFLEIKRKHENYISKNRSQIYYHQLTDLFKTEDPIVSLKNHNSMHDEDGKKFLYYVLRYGLRPTVLVVFDREAYYSRFNSNLRLTIDKNLRYYGFPELTELYKDHVLQNTLNGNAILEIKFSKGFPDWLQSILTEYGLTRAALSKYTICLDAQKHLNPATRRTTLPFNRGLYRYQ